MKYIRYLIYVSLVLVLAACTSTPDNLPNNSKDPGFELIASSTTINLTEVNHTEVALELSRSNGFEGTVELTLTELPEGVSADFSENPIIDKSVLKLTASSEAKLGSGQLVLEGKSGTLEHSLPLTLIINAADEPLPEPDEGNTAPILASLEDQTLIRNFITPNELGLALIINDREQTRFTVTVNSSNQDVLQDNSFECDLEECFFQLVPKSEVTAESKLTVTVDDGANGLARQRFLLKVVPHFVKNTNDAGEGSLRQTIVDAKAGDVIGFNDEVFADAQTITLASPLLIDKALSIEGTGRDKLRLSGGNKTNVLYIQDPTVLVAIQDLQTRQVEKPIKFSLSDIAIIEGASSEWTAGITVQFADVSLENCLVAKNKSTMPPNNGAAGGIANFGGKLFMNNCEVSNNSTFDNNGGGILNLLDGQLVIEKSVIANNKAESTVGGIVIATLGGGIANFGQLSIDESTVVNANHAYLGGGIANSGKLKVSKSLISRNTAVNEGGGLYNLGGTVIISESTFGGPTPEDGNTASSGGGIYSDGKATITNSFISHNSIDGDDSEGIFNLDQLSLINTSVNNNFATGDAGGIVNTGTLKINNSQIVSNKTDDSHGGGIENEGVLDIENSEIIKNKTTSGQGGVAGGIYNDTEGVLTLKNSNISKNFSDSTGGGIHNEGKLNLLAGTKVIGNKAVTGGGIYNQAGTTTLSLDSLIVKNQAETGGGIFVVAGEILGIIEGENGNLRNNQPNDIAPRDLTIDLKKVSISDVIELDLTGPNGFREVITETTTLTNIPAGTYTLIAPVIELPGTHAPIVLRPDRDTQTIQVAIAGSSSTTVSYTALSNLKVTINKDGDFDADVTVTGPNGFSQTLTETSILTGLELGTYTVNSRCHCDNAPSCNL